MRSLRGASETPNSAPTGQVNLRKSFTHLQIIGQAKYIYKYIDSRYSVCGDRGLNLLLSSYLADARLTRNRVFSEQLYPGGCKEGNGNRNSRSVCLI